MHQAYEGFRRRRQQHNVFPSSHNGRHPRILGIRYHIMRQRKKAGHYMHGVLRLLRREVAKTAAGQHNWGVLFLLEKRGSATHIVLTAVVLETHQFSVVIVVGGRDGRQGVRVLYFILPRP
jgi:hypothetical protein